MRRKVGGKWEIRMKKRKKDKEGKKRKSSLKKTGWKMIENNVQLCEKKRKKKEAFIIYIL